MQQHVNLDIEQMRRIDALSFAVRAATLLPDTSIPPITWYRGAAFRFVLYRTDGEEKFRFAQGPFAQALLPAEPMHGQ
jgi:hypothetical protein